MTVCVSAGAALRGRDVHREPRIGGPVRRIVASLAQHPFAERDDEADLLGDADELGRRQQPLVAVTPAQQRLEAAGPLGADIDDRLVVHLELAARQGIAHRAFEIALRLE